MRDKKSAEDRARATWSHDDRDLLLTLPGVAGLKLVMPVVYLRDLLVDLKAALTPEYMQEVQADDLTVTVSMPAVHDVTVYMDCDQLKELLKSWDLAEEMFARLSPAAAVEDGAKITVRRKGAVPEHVAALAHAVETCANTLQFNSTPEQLQAAKLELNLAVAAFCQAERLPA